MTETPTAGRFEGRAHLLPVRVYYEDTDFTGVVYHANYVRFFERGRSDFLRSIGIGHLQLLESEAPMAFVIAAMTLTFVRPARIDDALTVRTLYDSVKGPRLMISQTIEREGELLCRAGVTAVCVHLDGRPRRPGRVLVEAVSPWLVPVGDDG